MLLGTDENIVYADIHTYKTMFWPCTGKVQKGTGSVTRAGRLRSISGPLFMEFSFG